MAGVTGDVDMEWSQVCVLVEGLPDRSTVQALTIHFQSRRRSGGGDIEDDGVKMLTKEMAIIRFCESETCGSVLSRADQSILIDDETYNVKVKVCPKLLEVLQFQSATDTVTSVGPKDVLFTPQPDILDVTKTSDSHDETGGGGKSQHTGGTGKDPLTQTKTGKPSRGRGRGRGITKSMLETVKTPGLGRGFGRAKRLSLPEMTGPGQQLSSSSTLPSNGCSGTLPGPTSWASFSDRDSSGVPKELSSMTLPSAPVRSSDPVDRSLPSMRSVRSQPAISDNIPQSRVENPHPHLTDYTGLPQSMLPSEPVLYDTAITSPHGAPEVQPGESQHSHDHKEGHTQDRNEGVMPGNESYNQPSPHVNTRSQTHSDHQTQHGGIFGQQRAPDDDWRGGVLVNGIAENTSEDCVKQYFASHHMSGGGPIQHMDYNPDNGKAFIVYQDKKYMHQVLNRRTVVLSGVNLDVHFAEDAREVWCSASMAQKPLSSRQRSPEEGRRIWPSPVTRQPSSLVEPPHGERDALESPATHMTIEPKQLPHGRQDAWETPATHRTSPWKQPPPGGQDSWESPAQHRTSLSKQSPLDVPPEHGDHQASGPRTVDSADKTHRTGKQQPLTPDPRLTLYFSGLCEDITKVMLTSHLVTSTGLHENQLKNIMFDQNGQNALVIFSDIPALEKVLQLPIILKGKKLNVRLSSLSDFASFTLNSKEQSKEKSVIDTDHLVTREVTVLGVTDEFDEEYLTMILESDRYAGQTDSIENINVDVASRSAAVTFKTSEAAARLLRLGRISIDGTELTIRRRDSPAVQPSSSGSHVAVRGIPADASVSSSSGSRVAVREIPADASVDSLRYCLEDQLRCRPSSVLYSADRTAAITTFADSVRGIEKRNILEFEDSKVKLSLMTETQNVLVTGLDPKVTDDYLEIYFESPKSHGGPNHVKHLKGDATCAVVCFNRIEDAANVLNHKHKLADKAITVVPFYEELGVLPANPEIIRFNINDDIELPHPTEVSGTDSLLSEESTVEVHNVDNTSMQKEILELLFENRRKSGGGPIQNIEIIEKKNMALITYQNVKDARRVLDTGIVYHKDACLQVIRHTAPVLDHNRLVIHEIGDATSRQCLLSFLQAKTRCTVQEIQFSVDGEKALVIFQQSPDFNHLKAVSDVVKLDGASLTVERVERSSTVQVHGINESTDETFIHLYFESPKSWGGEIHKITMKKEDHYCLITFKDPATVDSVLQKSDHALGQLHLYVKIFHEEFGILPLGHDPSQPGFKIPETIRSREIASHLILFLARSKDFKEALLDKMATVHAKILWPDDVSVKCLMLCCTLTKQTKDYRNLAKQWKERTSNTLKNFLQKFEAKNIDVLQSCWDDVMKEINKMKNKDRDLVRIEPDKSQFIIEIVGVRDAVHDADKAVDEIIRDVNEKREKQALIGTEMITTLSEQKLKILIATKFQKHMKDKYNDLNLSIDLRKGVTITGMPTDIRDVKIAMYERVNNIVSQSYVPIPSAAAILKSKKTQQYIVAKFKAGNITAVWTVEEDGVVVSALSKKEAITAVDIMKKEVTSCPLDVPESAMPIMQGKQWATLISDLQNLEEYKGILEISKCINGQVTVATLKEISTNVIEILKNFLRTNTILEQFVGADIGLVRFLEKYKVKEIKKIAKDRVDFRVKITPVMEDPETGFCVSGTADGLEASIRELNQLITNVVTGDHIVNMPGMAQFFKCKEGQDHLDLIETKHSCVVETVKNKSIGDKSNKSSSQSTRQQIRAQVSCKNGAKVIVMKHDMTCHSCDVIVNAANGQLQHVGGLAKAIVDKGGKAIQSECDQIRKVKGDLLDGQVVTTDSGRLPCKKIIHAVGPVWQGGKGNEENVLFETASNALDEVEKLALASIAFPAISSGVFGFPVFKSTEIIVEAVWEYFDQNQLSTIQEVHLLDVNDNTVDAFCKALVRKFGKDNVTVGGSVEQDEEKPFRPKPAPRRQSSNRDVNRQTLEGKRFHSAGGQCIKSEHGITVTLKKAAIASEQVDVIVNTTGKDLNLNAGAVSASLLTAAGPQLQAECTQNVPASGYHHGNVVATGGYNLSCQQVFHGSCKAWDNGAGASEKVLRQYISTCLNSANGAGYSSIAFPAIGTGNLRFPPSLVASVMFDEVYNFGKSNSPSSLDDVRIILYDKDIATIQAFEQELKHAVSGKGIVKSGRRFQAESAAHETVVYPEDDPDSASIFHSYNTRKNFSEIMVGDLTIQMLQGDLTKENTHAIVNSTNSDLDFTIGAVSQAIARAAGQALIDECQTIGKVHDRVAITSAGNLPCRNIIHMVAPSSNSAMREWQKAIRLVLKEADKQTFQSISFPALGTGQIGAPPGDIADAIYDAMGYFMEHDQPRHLKLVRIVIFQAGMVDDFRKAMKAKQGKSYRQKGMLEKIGGFFGMNKSRDKVNRSMHSRSATALTVSLKLYIYASSAKHIQDFKQSVDDYCKKQVHSEIISNEWGSLIEKLTKNEITEINSHVDSSLVLVEIETRLKRIRIQGQAKDVMSLKDAIMKVLINKQDDIKKTEDAKAMYTEVVWQFEDSDGDLEDYPMPISYTIETEYKKKKPYAVFKSDEGNHKVDFKTMKELCGKKTCKVQRHDKREKASDFELPATWSKMGDKEDLKLVTLQTTDAEYGKVLQQFQRTAGAHNIIKMQRIQNPGLFQRYKVHKMELDKRNKAGINNERMLWHGTSGQSIDHINRRGFDRGFHGVNGTAYGKGVYFAVNASYSVGYARPNGQGHRFMFYCKVLTGEYVQGSSGLIVPPAKDSTDASKLYDTVVDNISNPQMFVVFQDSQAYPEYLITFS